MTLRKPNRRLRRGLKIILGILGLGLVMIVAMLALITLRPDIAAQNIDRLRDVIGDAPVAQLKSVIFSIQDTTQQLEYKIGLVKPAAPWTDSHPVSVAMKPSAQPSELPDPTRAPSDIPTLTATITTSPTETVRPSLTASVVPATTVESTKTSTPTITPSNTAAPIQPTIAHSNTAISSQSNSVAMLNTAIQSNTPIPIPPTAAPSSTIAVLPSNTISPSITPSNTVAPSDTPTPIPPTVTPSNTAIPLNIVTPATSIPLTTHLPAWQPSALTPFGTLAGEGNWSPYLYTADGQTAVAYRTFLQPDPLRPYSIAAIVAVDLQATRLHFVLGTVEPLPLVAQPTRTGTIPNADLQPGILLATFNGGFKARHGHYGAMADGVTALPPIAGLATVAIYANGQVKIGEWGTDIKASPDLSPGVKMASR